MFGLGKKQQQPTKGESSLMSRVVEATDAFMRLGQYGMGAYRLSAIKPLTATTLLVDWKWVRGDDDDDAVTIRLTVQTQPAVEVLSIDRIASPKKTPEPEAPVPVAPPLSRAIEKWDGRLPSVVGDGAKVIDAIARSESPA